MELKTLKRSGLVAVMMLAIGCTSASAKTAKPLPVDPLAKPTITAVSETTKSLISVFRQTDPVTVPQGVLGFFAPNPKTGTSDLGVNGALARPAYSDEAHSKPPVWLIPGADDVVLAFNSNAAGKLLGGGGGSVNDAYFKNYGAITWSPGIKHSHWRTAITIFLPDSITTAQIITHKRGHATKTTTYTAHDNVIVENPKYAVAVVINGKTTDLQFHYKPKKKH